MSKMLRRGNRQLVSTLCHFLPHKPGVVAHAAGLLACMLTPINIDVEFLTILINHLYIPYYHVDLVIVKSMSEACSGVIQLQ